MYKLLITTSGTGSRLGELVKNTNKSLVLLHGKPIIDHIIDSYPQNIEIVLTLGYFGDKVKDHLIAKYPNRIFQFVTVDKYQGEGTSLGYSMLQAKSLLQSPFIFNCNDTIPNGPIPSPNNFNWDGGSSGQDTSIFNTQKYSSYIENNGYLTQLNQKGALSYSFFHIGLAGFKNYQEFWSNLEVIYHQNPNDSTLNDCAAIQLMISQGFQFKSVEFPLWLDTGNLEVLQFANHILSK